MKTLNFFIAILLLMSLSFPTYSRTIDDVLKQPEQKSGVYRLVSSNLEAAVINMAFGTPDVSAIMNRSVLKDAYIVRVDVVFTNYPKNIDMENLNRQRIIKALGIRSDLIKDEGIEWRMVRQMYCNNEAEAKLLFHGVVIYYLPAQDKELYLREYAIYKDLPESIEEDKVTNKDFEKFPDSTVVAAFRRNNWKKDLTIVSDVTGSMSPYIQQTTLWFLLNLNKKHTANIVLFNDGDSMSDSRKMIGRTGGVYNVTTDNFRDYKELLLKATSRGNGGDIQENDIEAILRTQELYPKAKEIILIADNFSNMRDYELIDQVKVPIRVVLCGTQFGINLQYLNLAWKSGGSVHTMEDDLKDLIDKSEGDKFKFKGKTYWINDGKIKLYGRPTKL